MLRVEVNWILYKIGINLCKGKKNDVVEKKKPMQSKSWFYWKLISHDLPINSFFFFYMSFSFSFCFFFQWKLLENLSSCWNFEVSRHPCEMLKMIMIEIEMLEIWCGCYENDANDDVGDLFVCLALYYLLCCYRLVNNNI